MYVIQKRVKNKIVISSFLDHFYNKSHNIVIPATCDASETKWQINKEHADQAVDQFNGITLIYAGNPGRKDLLHVVINVVQRLIIEGVTLRFFILGITREKYLVQFTHLLHYSNLSDNIKFLGRVSQDLIPAFYSLSDFMVLIRKPNRKSNAGFPTKFAESFISGTPVIANLTSDLGKYLYDGETGFVVPEPTEEAIYQTLRNKVLPLKRSQIHEMKLRVKDKSTQLNFHAFVEPLRKFIDELM